MKTVIIGGVAGGATAAARLRRLDEKADIVIFERGEYISFANCGLPYYVGGSIAEESELKLQTPESFNARFNVRVRVRSEVYKIDTAKKLVYVRDLDKNEEYEESYDKLIVSPGAMPIRPPFDAKDSDKVFTVRNIPDASRIKRFVNNHSPKHALVAGGGFIGLEMAENLMEAGVKVTVIDLLPHVLPVFDEDSACYVHEYLDLQGLETLTGTGIKNIKETEKGLLVETDGGSIETDMVILSLGVRPDTAFVKEAGISCDERGYILVDDAMRTSAPDVYAVGDAIVVKEFVTGSPARIALAGPANKQGRIAADQICGIDTHYAGSQGSSVIKIFDRTAASTGLTERAAKAAGIDYGKVHLWQANHAGYYPGSQMIAVKVLYEKKTGRILGGQFFGGDGTDKRADILAVAIRARMTAKDLENLDLCYAPPYSSARDPVIMAGMAIQNTLTGLSKTFYWENLGELDKDAVNLLDVRTKGEYAAGNVDGFKNIPLHELRNRLGELDPAKPVYVHCFSGLRSYVACRILIGNGFDCYNISGGYRLYTALQSLKK